LERFTAGIQDALRANFIGAYLVGSLATGDFDLDSDIDFLVITNKEPTASEVLLLEALHREIHSHGSYPAEHLEGSYLGKDMLAREDMCSACNRSELQCRVKRPICGKSEHAINVEARSLALFGADVVVACCLCYP
jgi:hypothetical protein